MTPAKTRNKAGRWAGSLVDVLLPRHCVLCGGFSGPANLCAPCTSDLPRIPRPCHLCGLPLHSEPDQICGPCLTRPPPWDAAVAALEYRFPADQLICRFKFGRNNACGEVLAQALAQSVRSGATELPGCIVPVPLHWFRQFRRSFNQADVLARRMGRRLGVPVQGSILSRQRPTRAHSGLDAVTRQQNIRGAFACAVPDRLRSRMAHVALIDDVLTTGATLAECCRVLKRAGAGRVVVWAAARAL